MVADKPQKLKVLIVGGEDHNITDRVRRRIDITHIKQHSKVTVQSGRDAKAIVILVRFCPKQTKENAVKLGKQRGIPVVRCETGNYILQGLTRYGLLEEDKKPGKPVKKAPQKEDEPKEQEKEVAPLTSPEEPTQEMTSIGISQDELVRTYLEPAKTSVLTLMAPGETAHEKDLIELVSADIGIPDDCVRILLEEVSQSGIVTNPVPGTWYRMGENGYEFDETIEAVPEPTPAQRKPTRAGYIEKVPGLPEGPYSSRYGIGREMSRYLEFRKPDGSEFSSAYYDILAKSAMEKEYIYEKEEKWYVLTDEQVALTIAENAGPSYLGGAPKRVYRKDEPDEEEPAPSKPPEKTVSVEESGLSKEYVSLATLQAEKQDKAESTSPGQNEKIAIRKLGAIKIPPLLNSIGRLKKMLPGRFWDEQAVASLKKRIKKSGLPIPIPPKECFTSAEWDALVWETLNDMTVHDIVPLLLEDYQDMKLDCRSCGVRWTFTVADQKRLEAKYGEVIPPSTCWECQKARYGR